MKKLIIVVCLLIAVSSHPGYAEKNSPALSINHIMADIGNVILELYPLIVAQREFSAKETEQVSQALSKLSDLFRAAKPFIDVKPDGYQISYEFVSQYLTIVKTELKTSGIDSVRSQLYALGEICISCHTQDTTLRTLFSGTTRKDFSSDYAFAEFNYMTRNYDDAVKYYDEYLMSSKPKTELDIIQPLQRIVTIYIQIRNELRDGLNLLKKYTSLKQHTPETRAEVENWIIGLEGLESDGVSNLAVDKYETLQTYIDKYLGAVEKNSQYTQFTAKEEVARVWLRGQLYHYLNKQPSENEVPMLLYWLSVADRSVAYNYYFSLADLYLKRCVLKYPKHPYAQRCFDEYKNYVNYTYLRQGEKIPQSIVQEIIKMHAALVESKNNGQ